MALVDLDAELVRIRDARSRVYFNDALKSYRAGAYRAAIAATWVALAYDILRKYRELAGYGDAEAARFIKKWDASVSTNNIASLLELERDLLQHAHEKMNIVDAMGYRSLRRLYEDRHLSAHPAFANQDELYEPSDELVRAHMAATIELVLSQRPVQGKGLFTAFGFDLQSPGFPTSSAAAHDYVEQKYLSNMRPSVLRNFGVILAKSLIRNVTSDWEPYHPKVAASLRSLKNRRPAEWPTIETDIVKLINDDDPEDRLRSVALLANFPELLARLQQSTVIALQQVATEKTELLSVPSAFGAVELEEFRSQLLDIFTGLDDDSAALVVANVPSRWFWDDALRRFAKSANFRTAEARFAQFIAPFSSILEEAHLDQLFEAIQENGQIGYANLTPSSLAVLMRSIPNRRPSHGVIDAFYDDLGRHRRHLYDETWKLLMQRGWMPNPDQSA